MEKTNPLDTTVHFEQLWVQAEQASLQDPPDEAAALRNLNVDISNYQMVDSFNGKAPEGYVENGKKRIIGSMLMHIAHLSGVANVDVYAALRQAMESLTIRKQSTNEPPEKTG